MRFVNLAMGAAFFLPLLRRGGFALVDTCRDVADGTCCEAGTRRNSDGTTTQLIGGCANSLCNVSNDCDCKANIDCEDELCCDTASRECSRYDFGSRQEDQTADYDCACANGLTVAEVSYKCIPLTLSCSFNILGAICGEVKTLELATPVATSTPRGLTITPDPMIPVENTDVAPWQWFRTYTVVNGNGDTDTCVAEMSVVGNCINPDETCDPERKVCEGESTPAPTPGQSTSAPNPVCPNGDDDCGEPHMRGLRGQRIDWSGVDGGWYSLIKDDNADLHISVRLTAPLPDEYPDRQLMTSLSILSEGHSLVIEVDNPYTIETDGCPEGVLPCLANGGLRILVDGQEVHELLQFSRQVPVADGAMSVSASNLPVECRQFGGDRIWARMYQEMLDGRRQLAGGEILEDWILRYDHMAAPGWCAKFVAENNLADLQSIHAIFKIETATVTVRLNAGVNYQGDGELDWDGRVLPDLEFWQMDVGMIGLDVDNPELSGLLGETAHPVYDQNGNKVMEGFEAFRGTVEDYRVSSALGTHFPLLDKTGEGHQ